MKGAMLAILFALITVVLTLTGCTVDCEFEYAGYTCKAELSQACCDSAKDGKDDDCSDDDKKADVKCESE